jgi:hypothetical protein
MKFVFFSNPENSLFTAKPSLGLVDGAVNAAKWLKSGTLYYFCL